MCNRKAKFYLFNDVFYLILFQPATGMSGGSLLQPSGGSLLQPQPGSMLQPQMVPSGGSLLQPQTVAAPQPAKPTEKVHVCSFPEI